MEASTTSEAVDDSTYELKYGSATLYGKKTKDRVCLPYDDDMCVHDFEFFKITSETGLPVDGILGLSPD